MSDFSSRLKRLRKRDNFSREGLGNRIGVSYSTIAKYESGTREPDFDTLNKIAEIFEVSVDYLLGKSEAQQNKESDRRRAIINKIATEFPDSDLMFNDLASMTADDLEEVYNYIKYIKSKKN